MKMIKRFASYYRPHWRLFSIDMFCSLLVAGCDLVYPMIARDMINIYVPNQNLRLLIVWGGVLLLIYIVKALMEYVMHYWGHIVGVRMQADMRRDMFYQFQKLPFSFFDENKTGTLLSRMVNDLQDVSELAHHAPENVLISSIMFIGSLIMLGRIDLLLTAIIFTVIPIMVFVASKMRNEMNDAFTESRVETGEVNSNVEMAISGMRVSRSYTAATHEVKKFDNANEKYKRARGKSYRAMGRFFSSMTFFNDLLYLLVLVAGGLFYYYDRIDVGDFTAYLLYVAKFLKPVNMLVNLFEQLQSGMTGFRRFVEIMDTPPEKETGTVSVDSMQGNIEFSDVSFKYESVHEGEGEIQSVISHLSMNISRGRTVALVGPSGGGKTTLCNLIPRFYEIDSGEITIDGINISEYKRESLRKNIGIVAQDVFLFNGTIKENIAYGNLDASMDEIIEAAKKAHIHDHIMSLPDGYETGVGERGVKLSGGQKQRISIARVFLKNPAILILDEATSALDNATEMLIQQALTDLAHGRTCIVVAHRLSTIKNADEIIVLTKDGIVERGTHEQLLAKGDMYAGLYKYQFRE